MRCLLPIAAISFAGLALAGCSSAVLETRTGPSRGRLALNRTLILADVAAPYRGSIEDAVARRLPGAIAAHQLPGEPTLSRLGTLSPKDWDALVLVTVTEKRVQEVPDLRLVDASDGSPSGTYSAFSSVWLYIDVSVQTFANRIEIVGVKARTEDAMVRRSSSAEKEGLAIAHRADAASVAARRLASSGIFE